MKVLICDPVSEEGITYLKGKGLSVVYDPSITLEHIHQIAPEISALIVRSRTKVNADLIRSCPKLKVIGRVGTGVDSIDTTTAQERSVAVVNAPGSNSNAVAEHTIGLILSLLRNIPYTDTQTRAGNWPKSGNVGTELKDKTVGIIGLGQIGSKVKTLVEAFGCHTLTHDYKDSQENLKTLLATSDIITLHVPLTDTTRDMIDGEAIELMKDGVYIINTSRAEVIVENDLYKGLESGKIGGVGMDVYWQEPLDSANKLNNYKRTVLTSHIAGQTREASRLATLSVAADVVAVLKGESPKHRIV